MPNRSSEEERRQARIAALRGQYAAEDAQLAGENLKQLGTDLWENTKGLGSIGRSIAQNAFYDTVGGLAGAGTMLGTWDMDKAADVTNAVSDWGSYMPNQRGQEQLAATVNALKSGAGKVGELAQAKYPLASHAIGQGAEAAAEGWEKFTQFAPGAAAVTAGVVGAIDPTHGRARSIGRMTDDVIERGMSAGIDDLVPSHVALERAAAPEPIWRNTKLTGDEAAIEKEFADWIESDPEAAMAAYAKLPGSEGGNIINTDVARELSPRYMADRSQSNAVQEPASWLMDQMLKKRLATPPRPGATPDVVISAGGSGAGKSTGLGQVRSENPTVAGADFTLDTTLSNYEGAIEKIEAIKKSGRNVHIVYTYRDPVEAFQNGVLTRATGPEGRVVPLDVHAKSHAGANETIRKLQQKYAGDDTVQILVMDNSRGPGNAIMSTVDNIPSLDYNTVREGVSNVLENARASGTIPEAVYRRTKGADAKPAAVPEDRAGNLGDAQQSEPQAATVAALRGEAAPPGEASPVMQTVIDALRTPERTGAVGNLWDAVDSRDEALAMALRGEHLKRTPEGGYVGAPAWVKTPEDLEKLRADADAKVEAGEYGMDWYDRARKEAEGLAPDDPAMQSLFARGGAIYSPQATPPTEVGAFARQHNARVLTGEDVRPRTRPQMENLAQAYGPGEQVHPEALDLGPKTGPYAEAKDPTVPEADLYKTANDIWHGRVMGYGEDFARGFTPQEHGFLTGENLLLAERAKARDAARGITREAEWNPRSAQAATWSAQREQKLVADALRKNAKGKKPPDMEAITAEARERASAGIPEAVDRNLAYINKEETPGSGLNEDPRAGAYTAESAREAIPDRDPIIDALRMYQRNALDTQGTYVNPQGVREHNPARSQPVLVGTEGGAKSPRTSAAEIAALQGAAAHHAFTRAQHSTGITRYFPKGQQKTKDLNAVMVKHGDLTPEQRLAIEQSATDVGADPIDKGDRTMIVQFGDQGPVPGKTQATVNALRANKAEGVFQRGRAETSLAESGHVPEEGTGVATEKILAENLEREKQIPGFEARTAKAVAADVEKFKQARDAAAKANNGKLRADITKALEILSTGGYPALREFVKSHGSKGLPAVVLAVALGRGQEEQPEGGA